MLIKRSYVVSGRNGYHAIDEYKDGQCMRTVIAGITKKLANQIAGELSNAVYQFQQDNAIQDQPVITGAVIRLICSNPMIEGEV